MLEFPIRQNAIAYTEATLAGGIAGLPNQVQTANKKVNNQVAAIRDFLSLYSVTKTDGITQALQNNIRYSNAANLFGDMISSVLIGGASYTTTVKENGKVVKDANGQPKTKTVVQNDYPNINAVLQKLGVTTGSAPFHQNHFHIYLKPPTIQLLPSTLQQLNTAIDHMDDKFDAGTQTVDGLDQIKADKLLFEEKIMFALDVPAIAIPSESVAMVAQVDASKAKPISFDYLLKDCWETQPTPNDPTSAVRGSSVSAKLRNYFQTYQNRKINDWDVKVSLLKTTKNGELKLGHYIQDSLAYEGYGKPISSFSYDPQPGYLGKDRAVFAAEYGGKRYKVVLDIVVSQAIVETGPPTCPEPQLIRLKKPIKTSGSDITDPILTNDLAAWQRSAELSALIASARQSLSGFTDLPSTALGQTAGEGTSAQITLDQNAAGHGWYIDPTPLDNTDDYLVLDRKPPFFLNRSAPKPGE